MKIKIKGKNPQDLQDNISRVMNLANVVVSKGEIPDECDTDPPFSSGKYWRRIHGKGAAQNHYNILPNTNSHFAFIEEETEEYIVIEFFSDHGRKFSKLLTEIILELFNPTVTLIRESPCGEIGCEEDCIYRRSESEINNSKTPKHQRVCRSLSKKTIMT